MTMLFKKNKNKNSQNTFSKNHSNHIDIKNPPSKNDKHAKPNMNSSIKHHCHYQEFFKVNAAENTVIISRVDHNSKKKKRIHWINFFLLELETHHNFSYKKTQNSDSQYFHTKKRKKKKKET